MSHKEPIIIFNNIINKVTQELEQILFSKNVAYKHNKNNSLLAKHDNILFIDSSIVIMGLYKISYSKNHSDLKIKLLKSTLHHTEFEMLNSITTHWTEIRRIYLHYLLMYNNLVQNYEDVPQVLIDNIVSKIKNKSISEDEYFFIPYQKKIAYLFENDKYLESMYTKNNYIIKFSLNSRNKKFSYKILSVSKNKLCQTKNNLKNLRFDEVDLIKQGDIDTGLLNQFITRLFNYGEIIG